MVISLCFASLRQLFTSDSFRGEPVRASRAGSAHALFSLKVFVVFIWGGGLARLPRSRLEKSGSRQAGPKNFMRK